MKLKKYAAVFIFLTFGALLHAQNSSIKKWKEGPLIWSDFTEKPAFSRVRCEFKYVIGFRSKSIKINDTVLNRLEATAFMEKKASWVSPEHKTPLLLRYNQVIFDIVEYHRRIFQDLLYRATSVSEAELLLRQTLTECGKAIGHFSTSSKQGEDLQVILYFELQYQKYLAEKPENELPKFRQLNVGVGLHAGVGKMIFVGPFQKNASPPTFFTYGFNFTYKKSLLIISALLGSSSVSRDFTSKWEFIAGERLSCTMLELAYGRVLADKSKIKIMPYAGIAIIIIGVAKLNDERGWLAPAPVIGLNSDYKLVKKLKVNPTAMNKEMSTTSVRARFFISYLNYGKDLNSLTLNFSLGFSGFGRLVKLN